MTKGGKEMIFNHMDRIVFAGDSVTDMESAQPVGEGLFENVGKNRDTKSGRGAVTVFPFR